MAWDVAGGYSEPVPSPGPSSTPGRRSSPLQLPTDRRSVFDCQRSPGTNPTDGAAGGKLNVQIAEHAWTSPIWFLP